MIMIIITIITIIIIIMIIIIILIMDIWRDLPKMHSPKRLQI